MFSSSRLLFFREECKTLLLNCSDVCMVAAAKVIITWAAADHGPLSLCIMYDVPSTDHHAPCAAQKNIIENNNPQQRVACRARV